MTNIGIHAKFDLNDLACFGGSPAFNEKIHVGTPNIGDRERLLARINDILDKRWLTNNGYYVREFERKLAELVKVKHCVAVCNATVALELVTRALELTGEVIVPSFTFVATAHALQWQEITPVFCDVHPATHMLDVEKVELMITPRTTGIIGVHLWGDTCDVEGLTKIARKRKLKLLFDAAHAFGCSHKGQMVGGFGEAEVFSFHATKFLNSFEGGAIATNNDTLAEKLRLMRNFGFHGFDNVIYIGTNGKMSEVSAAMGLTSLEGMSEFIAVNERNHHFYQVGLAGIPGIHLRRYNDSEESNYQYVVVEVDQKAAGLSRDELVQILTTENVIARRYFFPGCHRMEPYRSYYPHAGLMLPETEKLAARIMLLPTGTAVNEAAIATITTLIRFSVQHGPELSQHIRKRGVSGSRNGRERKTHPTQRANGVTRV